MHVFKDICICAYMLISVHMRIWDMWRPEVGIRHLLLLIFILFLDTWFLSKPCEQAGHWAPIPISHGLWWQTCTIYIETAIYMFLQGCWGSTFKLSCLHSKHLVHQHISLAWKICLLRVWKTWLLCNIDPGMNSGVIVFARTLSLCLSLGSMRAVEANWRQGKKAGLC